MDQPIINLDVAAWDALPQSVQDYWKQAVAHVNLPPLLSDVVAAGLNLENFDPRELAAMAGRDPVLGAKLLAVANSAKFGLRTPMTSIQRAVVHLGFNLVKTIIVAYQLETSFTSFSAMPKEYLSRVRRWSSCASVIAFQWAQAADLADPSTTATAALLSRLGTLVLGLGRPQPTDVYWLQPDELQRLAYEQWQWQVTSPSLSRMLVQHWGLPDPLPEMAQRQWEPLATVLPASYQHQALTLLTAAVVLAERYIDVPTVGAGEVLDQLPYSQLKENLIANRLLDQLGDVWGSARLQRELGLANEE
jgi:HD-like signal output (HDOD) protein